MHLRKGMLVRVIKGNHKGSEGKLLYVFPKKNKAIVEGVNMVKHSIRPTQENLVAVSPKKKHQSTYQI